MQRPLLALLVLLVVACRGPSRDARAEDAALPLLPAEERATAAASAPPSHASSPTPDASLPLDGGLLPTEALSVRLSYGKGAASVRAWCADFERQARQDPLHSVGLPPGARVCKEVPLPVPFTPSGDVRRAIAVHVETGGDVDETRLLVQTPAPALVTTEVTWGYTDADTSPSDSEPWPTSLEALRVDAGALVAIVALWEWSPDDRDAMRLVRSAVVCDPPAFGCRRVTPPAARPFLGYKDARVPMDVGISGVDWKGAPWVGLADVRVVADGGLVLAPPFPAGAPSGGAPGRP